MNDETSSASAALASWGQRAALAVLSALLLATPLANAQPTAAATVAPPARANTALNGTVLNQLPAVDLAACQTECSRAQGCAGWNFIDSITPAPRGSLLGELGKRQPAKCTLMTGKLSDSPATGVASCVMPCTSAPSKVSPSVAGAMTVTPNLLEITPIKPNAGTPTPKQPPTVAGGGVAIGSVVPPATQVPPPAPAPAPQILVGTGISDITGPVAEVVMMGYANTDQSAAGLHMRLYARAFVFAEPNNGRRVVFVSAELGQLFSSVKLGVLKNLAQRFGNLYDDRNVQIAATHTHAGPGGYSHHAIFNFTSAGHVAQNYKAIVDGITEAIVQAHNRLAPATVSIAAGNIEAQASRNRAPTAFRRNPDVSGLYDVNPEVTMLRIDRAGQAAGAISWFAVHNTSLTNTNVLVSSDHKGWAAHQFEKAMGSIAPFQRAGEFVAAFPNGEEGDQSPNITGEYVGPGGKGREFVSMQIIGDREFSTAKSLFDGANRSPVAGEVDFRHTFVGMPGYAVTSTNNRNGAGGNTLCTGAYGASFAAGAKDGPTNSKLFVEGMVLGPNLNQAQLTGLRVAFAETLFAGFSSIAVTVPVVGPLVAPVKTAFLAMTAMSHDQCQSPKPILIPSGALGWSPDVLPFQLLRVGPVVIAGIPGEMTVQAGRRLRERILRALGPRGVNRVILTGLANEYSAYVTTPEEYDAQLYEGASTLFGRLTLDAYVQTFGQLADAMAAGQPVPAGPTPRDLSVGQIELQTGVIFDDVPAGQAFGAVITEPPISARRNDSVQVRFRGAHPKNDLRRNDSYFRVERSEGGGNWSLVAWDSMPETTLIWQRDAAGCLGCSFVDVHWNVPPNASFGTYRIRHMGRWKHGLTGAITPYEGVTSTFEVGSSLVYRPATPAITPCGAQGQRACCTAERSGGITGPACAAGLVESGSCGSGANCTCGGLNPGGVFKSIGMCNPPAPVAQVTPCGGLGQRACCTAERPGGITGAACAAGLVEGGSCGGGANCTCGGVNPGGAFKSIGICSAPAPVAQIMPCGGLGQRACCVSERQGGIFGAACAANLIEGGSCGGGANCTCGGVNPGGAVKSIGMCARP